ncbi:ATP-dependent DNA helicase RecQ [Coprinopsis cinerea okayama7|uniref:DNA 3'-5' helicase n=1 Tax=Coprinopsis cinerea (strain Okayama-7 / 130 / ATCC MYA-4618 / FGSC 9003) TaxID=240176 RepID=D6RMF1_COPC7|nr:ATP-dependent DNA helicase RecQ [Coprinopsis cinerea okayama7\|eukprot:XP_002911113.1 ATP-dependent DNA helicase RecQ [Coprinopsis cinerea okayama7\
MSAPFSWFDDAKRALIRGILESLIEQWPSGPRDFQVEACASVMEKRPLIVIASTAMGKTATFFTPLLVYQYLGANPRPNVPSFCPPKPVVLVVTPLVELGNAHAEEMKLFGIRAVSVNSHTLAVAREEGRDLYKEIKHYEIGTILKDDTFRHNLVLLGIDEAHVLVPWSQEFRVAYRQMAQLRHRLPKHCALASKRVVYVASLDLQWRVASYGWRFYPLRRQHRAVRLWSSMTSASYNQTTLDLFAQDPETSVIVATVAFGMGMNVRNIQFSINLGVPESLESLVQQNGRAGRNLMMEAFGLTYVPQSILDSLRKDIAELNNDDASPQALYQRAIAFKRIRVPSPNTTKKPKEDPVDRLDVYLRGFLLAYLLGLCLECEKNISLGNPLYDPAVTCTAAQRTLPCGSCDIQWHVRLQRYLPPPPPPPPPPTVSTIPTVAVPSVPDTSTPNTSAPLLIQLDQLCAAPNPPPTSTSQPSEGATTGLPSKLTKSMLDNLKLWLDDFARKQWSQKDIPEARYAPFHRYWKGIQVSVISQRLSTFNSYTSFETAVSGWAYLEDDGPLLFEQLTRLISVYVKHIEDARIVRNARAAATRARNKGTPIR